MAVITAPPAGARDRAVNRVVSELLAGLAPGYVELTLTCEVIGGGRRQFQLRAGKNYQFVIPAEECRSANNSGDLRDEGALETRS